MLRNIVKKIIQYPRVTLKYPDQPFPTPFYNGAPEVTGAACDQCAACVENCPAQAISRADSDPKPRIDLGKCLFCSLCGELCPTGTIRISHRFELTERDRRALCGSPPPEAESDEIALDEQAQRLRQKAHKLFGRSLQIREVDAGSCNGCDYEINALNNPFNDLERFGMHFVASPRHADLLLVTGPAARNMEQALLKTYEATPEPKLVIAVGACACSGGIFRDSYATRAGIDTVLPVDAYIPGCPPRPQAILHGILKVLDRVE
jgi:Ni,Fe-hydrogenase III small subunit/Fe-S-cluster-containing hydrogenase component 2